MKINKSFATNFIAITLLITGYFTKINWLWNMGIFAFSGAITNLIAIHMLFEKVPFLYGSGVVERRFKDFKLGIKNMLILEFFTLENIKKFFSEKDLLPKEDVFEKKINYDNIFAELIETIATSNLGSMLALIGGKEALTPLKEPIINKLKNTVQNIIKDITEHKEDIITNLQKEISDIIDNRLLSLTPKKVKNIVQTMIRVHLGWLVVWGGVFGGLIGLFYGNIPF